MLLYKSHYEDKRMSKLAASFREYFSHAFSLAPSPQHSQSVKVFIFPMNILRAAFCLVHRRVDHIDTNRAKIDFLGVFT